MPLHAQLVLFRRATVLCGVHGSGLINSVHMWPGAALLQLMPFRVESGSSFFQEPAEARGVSYFEWRNQRAEDAVFHWHFLGADFADHARLLTSNSDCCGPGVCELRTRARALSRGGRGRRQGPAASSIASSAALREVRRSARRSPRVVTSGALAPSTPSPIRLRRAPPTSRARAHPPDFSFWINQDTRVDPFEFRSILRRALESPLNTQLGALTSRWPRRL